MLFILWWLIHYSSLQPINLSFTQTFALWDLIRFSIRPLLWKNALNNLDKICKDHSFVLSGFTAVQHERGPRTSTIRKQVALYFRGHKEVNGSSTHFPGSSLPGPPFFTTVTQLEPHNLEMSTVATTPERQAIVGLAQPTPKVHSGIFIFTFYYLYRVLKKVYSSWVFSIAFYKFY